MVDDSAATKVQNAQVTAHAAERRPCSDKKLHEATPPKVQHPVLSLPRNQGMPAGAKQVPLGGHCLGTTAGDSGSSRRTAPSPDLHPAFSGSLLLGSCLGHLHRKHAQVSTAFLPTRGPHRVEGAWSLAGQARVMKENDRQRSAPCRLRPSSRRP